MRQKRIQAPLRQHIGFQARHYSHLKRQGDPKDSERATLRSMSFANEPAPYYVAGHWQLWISNLPRLGSVIIGLGIECLRATH